MYTNEFTDMDGDLKPSARFFFSIFLYLFFDLFTVVYQQFKYLHTGHIIFFFNQHTIHDISLMFDAANSPPHRLWLLEGRCSSHLPEGLGGDGDFGHLASENQGLREFDSAAINIQWLKTEKNTRFHGSTQRFRLGRGKLRKASIGHRCLEAAMFQVVLHLFDQGITLVDVMDMAPIVEVHVPEGWAIAAAILAPNERLNDHFL